MSGVRRPSEPATVARASDEGKDTQKHKKRKMGDQQRGPTEAKEFKIHARTKVKAFANLRRTGCHESLPSAPAQDLVEKALFDHDLMEASADDERWVEFYEKLQRLSENSGSAVSAPRDDDNNDNNATSSDDNDQQEEEDHYQWATESFSDDDNDDDDDDEAKSDTAAVPTHLESRASLPPKHAITQAVHEYVLKALTNGKGRLPKRVGKESWDPSSLAALSMLVEEAAKSQAKFNAKKTMFAKSPRNQVLAAKRQAQKQSQGKGKAKEKSDG